MSEFWSRPTVRACHAVLLFGAVLIPLLLPPAAAVNPGQMNHFDFVVTPRAQGISGPFTATASIYYDTDPHATLIVYNLTLELDVPSGLLLVNGSETTHVAQVDLPPTVSLYEVTFEWNFTAVALGTQNLSLRVTSDNAGGGNASASVLVREGIVMGNVAGPTGTPRITDTLHFRVNVTSGFDNETVPFNVSLMVYETGAPVTPASVNGTRLRLESGEVVLGTGIPMNHDESGYWYDVPGQPRGTLIYWVFAETPYSNSTSAPQRVLVKDPAVSDAVTYGATAVVLGLAGAGVAYVVLDPARNRKASGFIHNSPDRIRMSVIVLILGAAFLTAGIVSGALWGLWGWFKYV